MNSHTSSSRLQDDQNPVLLATVVQSLATCQYTCSVQDASGSGGIRCITM